MSYYRTSVEHILGELERLDLLIRVQVARAREAIASDDGWHGLYISEQEVDRLVDQPTGLPAWATAKGPLHQDDVRRQFQRMSAHVTRLKQESLRRGVTLRLDELAAKFQLEPFDVDALLICLAPELDLRYERLFGYLQDDVTRKRPSVDLILNLLSPSGQAKLAELKRFTPAAPLVKYELLHLLHDAAQPNPPLLARFLKLDDRIVNYLLEHETFGQDPLTHSEWIEPRASWEDLQIPPDVQASLIRLAASVSRDAARAPQDQARPVLYLQGSPGAGRRRTAEALCRHMALRLLAVDVDQLMGGDAASAETAVRRYCREAIVFDAALYFHNFDSLLADEHRLRHESILRTLAAERPQITFLAGNTPWEPSGSLRELPFVRIEFPLPTYDQRVRLWRQSLEPEAGQEGVVIEQLANKFRLSVGQIQDAAATARNLVRWRDPDNGCLTMSDLYAACRLHSNRKLATLAQKITPHYQWNDIVLLAARLEQLREICNYVKFRSLVYNDWGFDRKLSMGKGLNVLFAGPSGTGKTMAAEIIAGELELELYRIDLSTVVSKYIGETEKNLSRIFAEAESSNAILFFDEADALFGKRSEVRDAHDRYANVEISYLLQRMEQYEGVVILATNLAKNMDEAFVRRMHVTVEFPFPGAQDRRRIWQQIWPAEAARSPQLDLDFMAQHIEVSGGNIRNIALAAAFLAAAGGEVIEMKHLVRATRREYQKMGKVLADAEFGDYAKLFAPQ